MRSLLLSAVIAFTATGGSESLAAMPSRPRPATILVRLPADARLTVDDVDTQSTSAERWLITPPLEEGKEFRYTLTARLVRRTKTFTVQDVVAVRAGRETAVTLDFPAPSEGAEPARLTAAPVGNRAPVFRSYQQTSSTSLSSDYANFQVLPMNEQDPMNGFGPPGFPEFSRR